MQDQNAGMIGKQRQLPGMKGRIAEMIENPVKRTGMFFKPGRGVDWKIGKQPGAVNRLRLFGDQRQIIIAGQFRDQFGAVIGNTGLLWRQG